MTGTPAPLPNRRTRRDAAPRRPLFRVHIEQLSVADAALAGSHYAEAVRAALTRQLQGPRERQADTTRAAGAEHTAQAIAAAIRSRREGHE